MDKALQFGMISEKIASEIDYLVDQAVNDGASLIYGGSRESTNLLFFKSLLVNE